MGLAHWGQHAQRNPASSVLVLGPEVSRSMAPQGCDPWGAGLQAGASQGISCPAHGRLQTLKVCGQPVLRPSCPLAASVTSPRQVGAVPWVPMSCWLVSPLPLGWWLFRRLGPPSGLRLDDATHLSDTRSSSHCEDAFPAA